MFLLICKTINIFSIQGILEKLTESFDEWNYLSQNYRLGEFMSSRSNFLQILWFRVYQFF